MKCINCQTQNNFKERTFNGGCCKQCGHRFVFDPKAGFSFSDGFFQKAIQSISEQDRYFFTPKQFLYFLEERFLKKAIFIPFFIRWLLWMFLFFVVSMFLWSMFFSLTSPIPSESILSFYCITTPIINLTFCTFVYKPYFKINTISPERNTFKYHKKYNQFLRWLGILQIVYSALVFVISDPLEIIDFVCFSIGVIVGVAIAYTGIKRLRNPVYPTQDFSISLGNVEQWLGRWETVNGKPEKLLTSSVGEGDRTSINREITAYSFDLAVICDRAEIAQFLIANNFHFDHHCAILSVTGYPSNIFATVLEMLQRNPNLTVYALHDASPRGVSLVPHLRTRSQWFRDRDVTIYDVGLQPKQLLNKPSIPIWNSTDFATQAQQLSPEVKQTLSPEELAWLEAGNYVELEYFSPKKLLQILTRTVALNRTEWEGDIGTTAATNIAIYESSSFG